MHSNTIGSLKIASSKRDSTYKNKGGSLHTTMDFGSVMCGKLERIHPNTSFSVGVRERVLLASLVRPTMGRIDLRGYHYFCPFSDLTENYAPMMAQQPVYRGSNSFTPLHLPNIPIKELSLFVLNGAQCTVYKENQVSYSGDTWDDLYKIPSATAFDAAVGSLPADCQTAFTDLGIDTGTPSWMPSSAGTYRFNVNLLLGANYTEHTSHIYLSNPTPASFFDYRSNHPDSKVFGSSYVALTGADYIVPVDVGQQRYTLAFRLSSFGRRLRKNLIGCGWQFNLRSERKFSLLPLVAYFKTYFDTFGLCLYNNWESTYAYKLMRSSDLVPGPVVTYASAAAGDSKLSMSDFTRFMMLEFGATYFTDEQDFISSHIRSTAVSPTPSGLLSTFVSVDNNANNEPHINVAQIQSLIPPDMTVPNGHALINDVRHGQLDSEILKRLYRQTNMNTLAGRRIAELLRAQGLGSYVDECKSNFIGSFSLDLNIYDIPSQSDTYNEVSAEGKHLGEIGAFGRASGKHDDVKYNTSEDGYFITLLVVVPLGGYAEGVDQDALNLTKYEQYNAEYDSAGYEFNPKLLLQGSQPFSVPLGDSVGSLDDSFGLAPRDFKRKFGHSKLNGDFSLRSTRKSYDPFHLERIIEVGERDISLLSTSATATRWFSGNKFNPQDLPIAGDVWRYLTRYPWLSRFQRIFYNDSISPVESLEGDFSVEQFEYFSLLDDDFVVHMIFDIPVYDQMLPVQDSFETTDDEHHANGQMSKA